jgi:hypothetical protein
MGFTPTLYHLAIRTSSLLESLSDKSIAWKSFHSTALAFFVRYIEAFGLGVADMADQRPSPIPDYSPDNSPYHFTDFLFLPTTLDSAYRAHHQSRAFALDIYNDANYACPVAFQLQKSCAAQCLLARAGLW